MTEPTTYIVRAHGGELVVHDVVDVTVTASGALVLRNSRGTCDAFAAVEWLSCLVAAPDDNDDGDGTEAAADTMPAAA